jgi:hypothetical protein
VHFEQQGKEVKYYRSQRGIIFVFYFGEQKTAGFFEWLE